MRLFITLIALFAIINSTLADSILNVPCNETDPTVGFLFSGECSPAFFDAGYSYIQCGSGQATMYYCEDPFCSQCKVYQQMPLDNGCDATGGSVLKCIPGQIDYSKYFGSDYVLTGTFGVRKLLEQQNASCTDDLNWVTIYKPNQCTPQATTSGFTGSQITTCSQGIVSSLTYSTPDCSGTPIKDNKVAQNTCVTTSDGYIQMSLCPAT